MPSPAEVKSLFRSLLRQGRGFPNYNIREYILRASKESFREGSTLKDAAAVEKAFKHGQEELEVVKRQAVVYNMFSRHIKNVLELDGTAAKTTTR